MKKSKKDKKFKKRISRQIIEVFRKKSGQPLNHKQLSAQLSIKDPKERKEVIAVLNSMVKEGIVNEVARGKFRLKERQYLVTGVIEFTRRGAAYVISQNIIEDVHVSQRNVGHALHGDEVRVVLFKKGRKKGPEGQVVEIVKRAREVYTGVLEINEKFSFFIPDDDRITVDFFVPPTKLHGAKHGQKVVAKLLDWPDEASSPFAEVVEVLGDPGDHSVEIGAILLGHGLARNFPAGVEAEAQRIPNKISSDEIKKRRDFRPVPTFTIDPSDAKDFDDALSFQELENGNYEIGIHIADVSHYVQPGTLLDDEAICRATSIYLVDRVIPMLPEVLSNQLCSLRPNEDKLCFSAVFEMTEKGLIKNSWIGRTAIHSNRRFTYEEVQEILEGKDGDFAAELRALNELAKKFREARMKSGAIAFEKAEVKFNLDDKGLPESVYFKVQKDAHKLIEEFMLLANKTVAESIGKPTNKKEKAKTFVYRIHDLPDPLKIQEFARFVKQFGYKFNTNEGRVSSEINNLLGAIKGKGEENMIGLLAIRTMSKAEYSSKNIGHYGLAFKHYSHFTSPIRRYPDIIAHRLLDAYANGAKSADQDEIESLCQHSSEMERKATEAERESIKFFQAIFLKDREGEEFEGVVSGITDWGLFIEITENKCEGMVRLKNIEGDYFYFDERNFRIIGQNTGRTIQLGDEVRIRVKHADIANKQLDFELLA